MKRDFKFERWMENENDDRVEENHILQNGGYFAKPKNEEGIDVDETSNFDRKP